MGFDIIVPFVLPAILFGVVGGILDSGGRDRFSGVDKVGEKK